jgi:sigma-E factor negative regulatory protein RseA
MKTEVSALLDGELEMHEAASALAGLRRDGELRAAWSAYQTIGAALRGEKELSCDITARVMAGLEQEPTVLCPPTRRAAAWPRPAVALAASAAGVAVVAWVAFAPQFSAAPGHADIARAPSAAPAAVVAMKPAAQREMQEYLVAHQAQASSAQLPGVTQNIRTVSASGGVWRR